MYSVKTIPLSQYQNLSKNWQNLTSTAAITPFTSWPWIESWLTIIPKSTSIVVIEAQDANANIVGIGLICEKHVRRHLFVKSKQWLLHRTGDDLLDQIWIEYNDFLLRSRDAEAIRCAMLGYLQSHTDIDEFICKLSNNWQLTTTKNWTFDREDSQPGYAIDLSTINRQSSKWQPASKSLARHIRSTEKRLNCENLELQVYSSSEKIAQLLAEFSHWHRAKWDNTDTPSGFSNSHFVNFHNQLNTTSDITFATCLIHNGKTVAVNYYLKDNTTLYFYCSFIQPIADGKQKLGILLHYYSIVWATNNGFNKYDFLAGKARYKTQFSDVGYQLGTNRLYRQSWAFRLESALAGLKSGFMSFLTKTSDKLKR